MVTGITAVGSLDALELIRRVRQNNVTARPPIIVLTDYAFDSNRERAFAAGVDVILSKPGTPDTLIRELRRLPP